MIEVDYLVVGAGAMGMAFADVLLTETDATFFNGLGASPLLDAQEFHIEDQGGTRWN